MLAVAFLAAGTLAAAAAEQAKSPPALTADQHYQLGKKAYYSGDYLTAKRHLLAVLSANPRHTPSQALVHSIRQMEQKSGSLVFRKRLEQTILKKVDFNKATLTEVLEFLRYKAREQGDGELAPNFVLKAPAGYGDSKHVTLRLQNVPLSAVLKYVGEQTGTRFKYERHAIVGTPVTKTQPAAPARESKSSASFRGQGELDDVFGPPKQSEPFIFRDSRKKADNSAEARKARRIADARHKSDASPLRIRLKHVVIPRIAFHDTPLRDVLEYLQIRTSQISNGKVTPNFVLRAPEEYGVAHLVNLSLQNIPVTDLVNYVGLQTGTGFRYDRHAVVAYPLQKTGGGEEVIESSLRSARPSFSGNPVSL